MKTTLDLDDRLLREAKRRAAASGTTLRAFVEDALRSRLLPRPARGRRFRLKLPVVTGTRPPAVDVSDRRALYDFMEQRR
jgi:Arc/MetJ family transcription regulator